MPHTSQVGCCVTRMMKKLCGLRVEWQVMMFQKQRIRRCKATSPLRGGILEGPEMWSLRWVSLQIICWLCMHSLSLRRGHGLPPWSYALQTSQRLSSPGSSLIDGIRHTEWSGKVLGSAANSERLVSGKPILVSTWRVLSSYSSSNFGAYRVLPQNLRIAAGFLQVKSSKIVFGTAFIPWYPSVQTPK